MCKKVPALLTIFTIASAGLAVGCGDTVIRLPATPTPVAPTPVVRNAVQFRVLGNPLSVRVRYSTPGDGLAQVVTTLPYENGFTTTATSLFLSLDASPTAYPVGTLFPFFSVQIVVNDAVFREATSQEATLIGLSVSGTWRQTTGPGEP